MCLTEKLKLSINICGCFFCLSLPSTGQQLSSLPTAPPTIDGLIILVLLIYWHKSQSHRVLVDGGLFWFCSTYIFVFKSTTTTIWKGLTLVWNNWSTELKKKKGKKIPQNTNTQTSNQAPNHLFAIYTNGKKKTNKVTS